MAGYKTWAVGEEVLAADLNSYIQSQVVAQFPSASARSATLPAPAVGQCTVLATAPTVIEAWDGSAWTRISGSGTAITYTPAWIPGGNLGTAGTISGRYSMIAPYHMYLRLALALGTAPSLSAGPIGFGLPPGYTAQAAVDQYGSGLLSYFGRGTFHAELSARASDLSRVLVAVPRGATAGTTDGSVATILEDMSNISPTGWAISGSAIRGSILLEVQQRW